MSALSASIDSQQSKSGKESTHGDKERSELMRRLDVLEAEIAELKKSDIKITQDIAELRDRCAAHVLLTSKAIRG